MEMVDGGSTKSHILCFTVGTRLDCFGRIVLKEAYIRKKCLRHRVLFLPSAMPVEGLVHCQMKPQINANEIRWAIPVMTL